MIWLFIGLLNALAVGFVALAETLAKRERFPLYFMALILIVGSSIISQGI